MLPLAATVYLLALDLSGRAADRARAATRPDAQRGSVTIEQVIWIGGLIALAGVVYAVVKAFVESQVGNITGGG